MKSREVSALEAIKDEIAATIQRPAVINTTFRLGRDAHGAIKTVTERLGFTHAKVFESLLRLFEEYQKSETPMMDLRAREGEPRSRKTYVVKKSTLSGLREVVKRLHTKRDLVVEKAALQYLRLVKGTESERKKSYCRVLEEDINPLFWQLEDLEAKLSKELGPKDPIARRLAYPLLALTNLTKAIEGYLRDDIPIDPDDAAQNS